MINYSDNLYVYFFESELFFSMDVKKSESGANFNDSSSLLNFYLQFIFLNLHDLTR